ncbi:4Fe-4S dicluster domain-containing protein [Chloroflexota bacterium]
MMNNSKIQEKLRADAALLLEQGQVQFFVGFENGSLKFSTTPLITSSEEDVHRLVLNPFIVNNLSVYLPDFKRGKTGIVVKGCDSRSLVSLLQDNQIKREDLFILGVPCSGVIDIKKIEKLVHKDRDKIDDITISGDNVVVVVRGDKEEFPLTNAVRDNCLSCEYPVPEEYDVLLDGTGILNADIATGRKELDALANKTPEERWKFWKNEFYRCIRCYACRSVCPACYCEQCFTEESEPRWIAPMPRWQDNLFFQTIRNIHVSGRCTDCGECEHACPVNIPLRSLAKEMCDDVSDLYDFHAGIDKDTEPMMTHYDSNDPEDFIR